MSSVTSPGAASPGAPSSGVQSPSVQSPSALTPTVGRAVSPGVFVGVDVGGTKTHIAWVDGAGARRDLVHPTSVWARSAVLGEPANLCRLAELITETVAAVRPVSVVVGLHGGDTSQQREVARSTLADRLGTKVLVLNDAQLIGPAAGVGPCISVIAGTGAIVVGVDRDGTTLTADGYGWLLGDHGSAPAIAREAVIRLLGRADEDPRAALLDPLGHLLGDALGASDAFELSIRFSAEPSAARWGELAPLVFEAAEAGSPLAHQAVRAAGEHLADRVRVVRRRGAQADCVVAAGGVITHQPLLAERLREALGERVPDLELHVLREPPVAGALALATQGR